MGDSDVLRDLRDFCSSIEFQQQAEEFALDHCHHFDDEEEHKLIYTELHSAFRRLFEGSIERFTRSHGLSDRDFFQICRNAQAADPESASFIDIFLASTEYDEFVKLMKFMRHKVAQLGDPRRAYMDTESAAAERDSGVEGTEGSVEVVEGQGQAMLDAIMGGDHSHK